MEFGVQRNHIAAFLDASEVSPPCGMPIYLERFTWSSADVAAFPFITRPLTHWQPEREKFRDARERHAVDLIVISLPLVAPHRCCHQVNNPRCAVRLRAILMYSVDSSVPTQRRPKRSQTTPTV